MKFTNHTALPDQFLRRLTSWCARQLPLPISKVSEIEFRNKANGYSGRCWVASGRIVVSTQRPSRWTWRELTETERARMLSAGPPRWADPVMVVQHYGDDWGPQACSPWDRATIDERLTRCAAQQARHRIDDLVLVTGHELAHRYLYLQGCKTRKSRRYGTTSGGGSEQQTRWHENQIVAAFNANRDELIAAWSRETERAAKPKPTRQEQNAQRAAEGLTRWERKLKLAQTKVKQYRRKVRRYDRVAAATTK